VCQNAGAGVKNKIRNFEKKFLIKFLTFKNIKSENIFGGIPQKKFKFHFLPKKWTFRF
jgi:hypothetical protein